MWIFSIHGLLLSSMTTESRLYWSLASSCEEVVLALAFLANLAACWTVSTMLQPTMLALISRTKSSTSCFFWGNLKLNRFEANWFVTPLSACYVTALCSFRNFPFCQVSSVAPVSLPVCSRICYLICSCWRAISNALARKSLCAIWLLFQSLSVSQTDYKSITNLIISISVVTVFY